MFTGSIKISELDALTIVTSDDFFPLVDSGSATTFRVTVDTLNNWFRISGSSMSSSWASASLTSLQSVSSSWASASLTSLQSVSSSWASQSISSSYALSASQAFTSSLALQAISASFAPFTQSVQVSASWASQSLSASHAFSASYAPVTGDTVPIGTIMAFASTTVPNNWLECNGEAKLTSSFLELYAAIINNDGTSSFGYLSDAFGNRDASGSYFKLPDLRGEFLRGWDNSRGVDPSRIFGTLQTSSIESHGHKAYVGGSDGTVSSRRAALQTVNSGHSGVAASYETAIPSIPFIQATGINETRPRNISVMWCIKYTNSTNFATAGATITGDVVGNLSASNVIKIQNIPVTSSAPTHGQILAYNSTAGVWAPASVQSNGLFAWATVLIPSASNYSSDSPATVATGNSSNKPVILNSFNISDISWTARTIHPTPLYSFGRADNPNGRKLSVNFLVTFQTTSSNLNYCLTGTWSEVGDSAIDKTDEGFMHFFPLAARTSTQMTASVNGGEFSGNAQSAWFHFVVFT
jgi:hypothetical protein